MHVGPEQPAALHALAHALNVALGGRGSTFDLIEPVAHDPLIQGESLKALIADMRAGRVTHLLILDCNPAYTAPAAWGFADALKRVPFSVSLAQSADETARLTTWFVPRAHEWETWSDARAYDGTCSILQPQALPLFGGVSAHELMALYGSASPISAEQAVRATWATRMGPDFRRQWADALAAGVVPGTASTASDVRLRADAVQSIPAASVSENHLSILFRADPGVWDGRYANNPWLQELPRPLTKIVWDNPLLIAPALARQMDLNNGDRARLSIGSASVVASVWVMPGQARRLRHGVFRIRSPRRGYHRRWGRRRLLSADRPERCSGVGQGGRQGRSRQHRAPQPAAGSAARDTSSRHFGAISRQSTIRRRRAVRAPPL